MKRCRLNAAATAALFAGALLASLRENGTSPIAWTDTLNDEISVRQCVTNDSCTLTGTGTSVRGYFHAVGWFELRSLLGWLGVGLNGSHIVIQVLNALATALVFAIAQRLGGRLAGVLAAWLFWDGYASLNIETAALYNSPPLPFLGAVFLLACMAAVERPGMLSVALAALVAAILANIHLACVLAGLSVVWVALLAPHRRIRLATFGALVFALATFLVAPPLWLHNAATLLQPPPPLGNVSVAPRLEGFGVICWSLLAVVAWIASLRSPSATWARCRRRATGALAVMVPFIAAFLTAGLVGLDATAKYLAHVVAASAIAAALPIALAARQLLHNLRADAADSWRRSTVRMVRVAPFVLAVMLPLTSSPAKDPPPTISDLQAVSRVLRDQHGWTAQQMVANVQASSGAVAVMGLRELAIADPMPETAVGDPTASAILVSLGSADLPSPLPPNWVVIRASYPTALVLIVTRSRIDWSRFDVCLRLRDGPAQPCQESGLLFEKDAPALKARNMPWGGPHWSGTLALRVPLRAPVPGLNEAIFMPRMRHVCGGRIGGAENGATRSATDRRQAIILGTAAGAGTPDPVELEWELGSPECNGYTYQGWPPFVVTGEATAVRLVEAILRKHEDSDRSADSSQGSLGEGGITTVRVSPASSHPDLPPQGGMEPSKQGWTRRPADESDRTVNWRAEPPAGQSSRYPHQYPRALAIFSATVQVLILLAATVFGWRALPSA